MKKAVFWAALVAGSMMMSGAAMASVPGGPFHKPGFGFPGFPGFPGRGFPGHGFPGNHHPHNGDGGHNAPLPIAAIGLPIAGGLLGYAFRRKKA